MALPKPFKVDFTDTQDGGSFYVKPGTYQLKCTNIEQKEGTNYPYIVFYLEVVGGNGATVMHTCSLAPKALFNLKRTLRALLNAEIPQSAMTVDPAKLIGRVCVGTVIDVPDKNDPNKIYSNIQKIEPMAVPSEFGDETI